jgi:hypothetical protein
MTSFGMLMGYVSTDSTCELKLTRYQRMGILAGLN